MGANIYANELDCNSFGPLNVLPRPLDYSIMNRVPANLAALMASKPISENELARKTGVPQPTIHRVLKGKSEDPRDATLRPLAGFFGVSVEQLRTAPDGVIVGLCGQLPRQPISAYSVDAIDDIGLIPDTHLAVEHIDFEISAGDGAMVPMYVETKFPMIYRIDWFHRWRAKPEAVKSMGVRGQSMERTLFDGDRIAVHISDTTVQNDHVYALLLDGQAMAKRLFRHGRGGLRIVSDNEDKSRYPDIIVDPEEMDRVFIIGRVIDKSGAGGL
jgi:transcriptional regulator with XRE-family HTH domain